MKVLVTGASGFTGAPVTRLLVERGSTVCDLADTNLLDVSALRQVVNELQPDAAIHLAGVAFVAHGDVDDMYRTNIVGTRNLLTALAESGRSIKKVILASSANVYGNADSELIDESSPARPTNDYAVSKYAMELAASLWRDRLPIVVTRPFNYTGVGQGDRFVIPKIVEHFARLAPAIELGNLDVWREYNDVTTVAEIYVRLIDNGVPNETYNICSGRLHCLADIFESLRELTGHDMQIQINPAFVRDGEVLRLGGNPKKLIDTLGEIPWWPIRETLAAMLSSKKQALAAA